MRCCGKLIRALWCGAILLLASLSAQAAGIAISDPRLVSNEEGYSLAADYEINFGPRIEEAVNRGIVLYFVSEFELTRSRWYWLDEQVVRRAQTWRLSYHAITRQYRLSTGILHQNFDSLSEALRMLSRIRSWQVLDRSELKLDQPYQAALRFRLDVSQMPKTFQVGALTSRDWNLSSDWVSWSFTPTAFSSDPAVLTVPALPSAQVLPATNVNIAPPNPKTVGAANGAATLTPPAALMPPALTPPPSTQPSLSVPSAPWPGPAAMPVPLGAAGEGK